MSYSVCRLIVQFFYSVYDFIYKWSLGKVNFHKTENKFMYCTGVSEMINGFVVNMYSNSFYILNINIHVQSIFALERCQLILHKHVNAWEHICLALFTESLTARSRNLYKIVF